MELKEFIEEVLVQLVEGVANAQEKVDPMRSIINKIGNQHITINDVLFEVVLSASNKTDSKKGIGVLLSSVMAGVSKEDKKENQHITKINFSVPIALPVHQLKKG